MKLESLVLELFADTSRLDREVKAAVDKAANQIKKLEQGALSVKVNEKPLHDLNKLLDVKQAHIKQTAEVFNNTLLAVRVDDSQVSDANSELKSLKNELRGIQDKTISVKVSHQSRIESKDKESGLVNRTLTQQLGVLNQINSKTQKRGLLSDIRSGLFVGLGQNLSSEFSKGFQERFQERTGIDLGATGKLLGDAFGRLEKLIENSVKGIGKNIAKTTGIADTFNEFGEVLATSLLDAIESSVTPTELAVNFAEKLALNVANMGQSLQKTGKSLMQMQTYLAAIGLGYDPKTQSVLQTPLARSAGQSVAPLVESVATNRKKAGQEKAIPLVLERASEIIQNSRNQKPFTPEMAQSVIARGKSSQLASKLGDEKSSSVSVIDENTNELFLTVGGYAGHKNKASGYRIASDIAMKAYQQGRTDIAALGIRNPDTDIDPEMMKYGTSKTLGLAGSLSKPNLRGYSKDAVEIAAQAVAAIIKNPNLQVKVVGESGGGYAAEEAIALLQKMGYGDNVSGIALGTPNFIAGSNPDNFTKLLGKNKEETLGYETHQVYAQMGLADVSSPSQNLTGLQGHPYENYANTDEYMRFAFGIQSDNQTSTNLSSQDIEKVRTYINDILASPDKTLDVVRDNLKVILNQISTDDNSLETQSLVSDINGLLNNDELLESIKQYYKIIETAQSAIPQAMAKGDAESIKTMFVELGQIQLKLQKDVIGTEGSIKERLLFVQKQIQSQMSTIGDPNVDSKTFKFRLALQRTNEQLGMLDVDNLNLVNKELSVLIREITDDKTFNVKPEAQRIKSGLIDAKKAVINEIKSLKSSVPKSTDIWDDNYSFDADLTRATPAASHPNAPKKKAQKAQSLQYIDPFALPNRLSQPMREDDTVLGQGDFAELINVNKQILEQAKLINKNIGSKPNETKQPQVFQGELLDESQPQQGLLQKLLRGGAGQAQNTYGIARGAERFFFDTVKGVTGGLVNLEAAKKVTQTVAPAFALGAVGSDIPLIGEGISAVSNGVVSPLIEGGLSVAGGGLAALLPEGLTSGAATVGGFLSHFPGYQLMSQGMTAFGEMLINGAAAGTTYLLGGRLAQKGTQFALNQAMKPLGYLPPASQGDNTYNLLKGVGDYTNNAVNVLSGKGQKTLALPPQREQVLVEVLTHALPQSYSQSKALPPANNGMTTIDIPVERIREAVSLGVNDDSPESVNTVVKEVEFIRKKLSEFNQQLQKEIDRGRLTFAQVGVNMLDEGRQRALQDLEQLISYAKEAGLNTNFGTSSAIGVLNNLKSYLSDGNVNNPSGSLGGSLKRKSKVINERLPNADLIDLGTVNQSLSAKAQELGGDEFLESGQKILQALSQLENIDLNALFAKNGKLNKAGKEVMAGLKASLVDGKGDIEQTTLEIASILPERFKKLLGIESPSKVFIAIGRDILRGLSVGLDGLDDVIKPILKDLEYLQAVKMGDIEKAQAMFSQESDKKGLIDVYHGSPSQDKFYSFSKEKLGSNTGDRDARMAFFATSSPTIARSYAGDKGFTHALKIPMKSLLDIDYNGRAYDDKEFASAIESAALSKKSGVIFRNVLDPLDGSSIHHAMESGNFDADILKESIGDSYAFFEPNQVKSADPVTYDDKGRVIPLSSRFDRGKDIRGRLKDAVNLDDIPDLDKLADLGVKVASSLTSMIASVNDAVTDIDFDEIDWDNLDLGDFDAMRALGLGDMVEDIQSELDDVGLDVPRLIGESIQPLVEKALMQFSEGNKSGLKSSLDDITTQIKQGSDIPSYNQISKLNDAKIAQLLGMGNWGEVYRLGDVALKYGEINQNEYELAKIAGESGIGPKVYSFDSSPEYGGRMAMDYVEGNLLSYWTRPDDANNIDDPYEVLPLKTGFYQPLIETYRELNKQGIATLDGHDENFILNIDDNYKFGVKAIDFGMSSKDNKSDLLKTGYNLFDYFKHKEIPSDTNMKGAQSRADESKLAIDKIISKNLSENTSLDDVKRYMDGIYAYVLGQVDNMPDLSVIGENLTKSLANGVNLESVGDMGSSIGESLDKGTKKALEIASPSKLYIRHGKDVVIGFEIGVDGEIKRIKDLEIPIPELEKQGYIDLEGLAKSVDKIEEYTEIYNAVMDSWSTNLDVDNPESTAKVSDNAKPLIDAVESVQKQKAKHAQVMASLKVPPVNNSYIQTQLIGGYPDTQLAQQPNKKELGMPLLPPIADPRLNAKVQQVILESINKRNLNEGVTLLESQISQGMTRINSGDTELDNIVNGIVDNVSRIDDVIAGVESKIDSNSFFNLDAIRQQFPIIDQAIAKFNQLKDTIVSFGTGAAKLLVFAFLGKQLVDLGAEAVNVYRRFEGIFIASRLVGDGAKYLEKVREQTKALGGDLESTMRSAIQFSTALVGTNLESTGQQLFLDSDKALKSLGLQTQEYDNAMRAIIQISSKGKVSMEELSGQLGEQVPGALQIAADAMQTNVKGLIQMVSSGNLLSEDFIPKFVQQLKNRTAFLAPAVEESLNASIGRLGAQKEDLFVNIGAELSPAVIPLVNALSGALKGLTDNFDAVVFTAKTLGLYLASPAILGGLRLIATNAMAMFTGLIAMMGRVKISAQTMWSVVAGPLKLVGLIGATAGIESLAYVMQGGSKAFKDANEELDRFMETLGKMPDPDKNKSLFDNVKGFYYDFYIRPFDEKKEIEQIESFISGLDVSVPLTTSKLNTEGIDEYIDKASSLRSQIDEIRAQRDFLMMEDPVKNKDIVSALESQLYNKDNGLVVKVQADLESVFTPGGRAGLEEQIRLIEGVIKRAELTPSQKDDVYLLKLRERLDTLKSSLGLFDAAQEKVSNNLNKQRLAWIELTSSIAGYEYQLNRSITQAETQLYNFFNQNNIGTEMQSYLVAEFDVARQQAEVDKLTNFLDARARYLDKSLTTDNKALIEQAAKQSILEIDSEGIDRIEKLIQNNDTIKNVITEQVLEQLQAIAQDSQALEQANLELAKGKNSLRQARITEQEYKINLSRSIFDFNKDAGVQLLSIQNQFRDYNRQLEDAAINSAKMVRGLIESYQDLNYDLENNILTVQNEILDAQERLKLTNLKIQSEQFDPGQDTIAKRAGSIILRLFESINSGESEKRRRLQEGNQAQKEYTDTLRRVRDFEEQVLQERLNQKRQIEDLTNGFKNLNQAVKDLVEQLNRSREDLIRNTKNQSGQDISGQLNSVPSQAEMGAILPPPPPPIQGAIYAPLPTQQVALPVSQQLNPVQAIARPNPNESPTIRYGATVTPQVRQTPTTLEELTRLNGGNSQDFSGNAYQTTPRQNTRPAPQIQSVAPVKIDFSNVPEIQVRLVAAEARGQSLTEQALVSRSIDNRQQVNKPGVYLARSNSIEDIINAPNQYEPVRSKKNNINAPRTRKELETAYQAVLLGRDTERLRAQLIKEGRSQPEIKQLLNATGFRTPSAKNDNSQNFNRVRYGGHIFNSDQYGRQRLQSSLNFGVTGFENVRGEFAQSQGQLDVTQSPLEWLKRDLQRTLEPVTNLFNKLNQKGNIEQSNPYPRWEMPKDGSYAKPNPLQNPSGIYSGKVKQNTDYRIDPQYNGKFTPPLPAKYPKIEATPYPDIKPQRVAPFKGFEFKPNYNPLVVPLPKIKATPDMVQPDFERVVTQVPDFPTQDLRDKAASVKTLKEAFIQISLANIDADKKLASLTAISEMSQLVMTTADSIRQMSFSLVGSADTVERMRKDSKGYLTITEEINNVVLDTARNYDNEINSRRESAIQIEKEVGSYKEQLEIYQTALRERKDIGQAEKDALINKMRGLEILMQAKNEQAGILKIEAQRLEANRGIAIYNKQIREEQQRQMALAKELSDAQLTLANARYDMGGSLFNTGVIQAAREEALQIEFNAARKAESMNGFIDPERIKEYVDGQKELADINISQSYLDAIPALRDFSSGLKDIILMTSTWQEVTKKLIDTFAGLVLDTLVIKPAQNWLAQGVAGMMGWMGESTAPTDLSISNRKPNQDLGNTFIDTSNALGLFNQNLLQSNSIIPDFTNSLLSLFTGSNQNNDGGFGDIIGAGASLITGSGILGFAKGTNEVGDSIVNLAMGTDSLDILTIAKGIDALDNTIPTFAKGTDDLEILTLAKGIDILDDAIPNFAKGADNIDIDLMTLAMGNDNIGENIINLAKGTDRFPELENFAKGTDNLPELENFAKGTMKVKVPNFAVGSIEKAFKKERLESGKDPYLAVLHKGEAVLSTLNGDAQLLRNLKANGQWEHLKANPSVANYAYGTEMLVNKSNPQVKQQNQTTIYRPEYKIYTENADSFRKSQRQIEQESMSRMRRRPR